MDGVEAGLRWAPFSNGEVPKNAVSGGWSSDTNEHFYVGRAGHDGDVVPGKVHPKYGGLFLPYAHKEHFYRNYEVLVQDDPHLSLAWLPASGGYVPPGAVKGGFDRKANGATYVGRTLHKHKGDSVPGKIVPAFGAFFYSSGNKEHSSREYQVLVVDGPDAYEMSDVRFDLSQMTFQDSGTKMLSQAQATNHGDSEATQAVTMTITKTSTHTWGHQVGLKIGLKTTVKTGFPCLFEGKLEVSGEISYTHNWGEAHQEAVTQSFVATAKVPAHSQMEIQVFAHQTKISVPYTATVKVVKNDQVVETRHTAGVYKGVLCAKTETVFSRPRKL